MKNYEVNILYSFSVSGILSSRINSCKVQKYVTRFTFLGHVYLSIYKIRFDLGTIRNSYHLRKVIFLLIFIELTFLVDAYTKLWKLPVMRIILLDSIFGLVSWNCRVLQLHWLPNFVNFLHNFSEPQSLWKPESWYQ